MSSAPAQHFTLEQRALIDECRQAVLTLLVESAAEFGVRDDKAIDAMQKAARERFDEAVGLRDRKSFDAVRSLTASRISLVHEDDLEFSIRLSDLAQQLRDRCEQQLGQLSLRFMSLLGQEDAADEQLAPGPETVCAGIRALGENVSFDQDGRIGFLQSIRPILAGRLPPFYTALNGKLEAAGVAPKNLLRASSSERPGRAFETVASRTGGTPATASGGGSGALEPMLAGALRDRMLAWLEEQLQSGNQSGGGAPQIARQLGNSDLAPLLSPEVREGISSVEAALKRISEARQIAEPARAALEGLRVPLLKLALREPLFVMDPGHAARRLVDALLREAVELPLDVAAGTTQLNLIEATVARLVREYNDDERVFDSILATLENARQERLNALSGRVETLSAALRNEERAEAVRRYASKAIRALCALEPPATVRVFLERYWFLVLRRVLLAHGDKSEEWKQVLKVADTLIWSMQPKSDANERNRLVTLLPNLVQHLNTGLEAIGLSEGSREKVLARFTAMHTEALHGRDPKLNEPTVPPTEAEPVRIDTSGHEARLRILRRPGFLARDAVAPAAFSSLAAGDVIELTLPDGNRSAAVIASVGQLKQLYVLQLRPAGDLLAITAAELARQAEEGSLSLRQAPLSFED